MLECQFGRVQRLATKTTNRFQQFDRGALRQPATRTVTPIADERMADRCEMHADLMRPTRFEFGPNVAMRAKALDDVHARDGGFAVGRHALTQSVRRIAAKRRIDRAAAGQDTFDNGFVAAGNGVTRERSRQTFERNRRCADDQQSAGVLVQPVDDPSTRQCRECRSHP
jgi:hypothetical protein